jgi:hypothetical protein
MSNDLFELQPDPEALRDVIMAQGSGGVVLSSAAKLYFGDGNPFPRSVGSEDGYEETRNQTQVTEEKEPCLNSN